MEFFKNMEALDQVLLIVSIIMLAGCTVKVLTFGADVVNKEYFIGTKNEELDYGKE